MNEWWLLAIPGVPLALLIAMLSGGKIGYALGKQAEREDHDRALRLSKTDESKNES